MALDLGLDNATWERFHREESFFLRTLRFLEEARRRLVLEREQLVNVNDFNGNFEVPSEFNALSGFEYGTNTNEAGEVFVRITAGPTFTVELFKSVGGVALDRVATGTGTAGSTVTLVQANNSGLSGTLRLAASVTIEVDDVHKILVLQDFKSELVNLWDGTETEDADSRDVAKDALDAAAAQVSNALAAILTGFSNFQFGVAGRVGRGARLLRSTSSTLFTEGRDTDGSGNVSRPVTGILQDQSKSWEKETTGAEQDIIQRVVAAGAAVFDSDNTGAGTIGAFTAAQRSPVGTFSFRCVRGLGDGSGGIEEFDGDFVATDSDLRLSFTGLRVKQTYVTPRGLGPFTLARAPVKTGDGSNVNMAGVPTSTAGERETNTDSGILHVQVTEPTPGSFTFSFYRASTLLASDLVAQATGVAVAATGVTAEAQNGSGLSVIFDAGSAPVAAATFTIDLKYFATSNTESVPDSFSITTTLTSEGKASRVLAEILAAELNGDVASSEQVDDDLFAGAGTFIQRMRENI